jgi:hypothetical protein
VLSVTPEYAPTLRRLGFIFIDNLTYGFGMGVKEIIAATLEINVVLEKHVEGVTEPPQTASGSLLRERLHKNSSFPEK